MNMKSFINARRISLGVLFCAIFIVLVGGCPMLFAPPAISAPTLEAGGDSLVVFWTGPSALWNAANSNADNGLSEYHLRYREEGRGIWKEITGISGLTYTITGLTNGITYEVQARAVNATGTANWSASATETPIHVPDAPDSPTLTMGVGQLTVKWIVPPDNGRPITVYHLRYSEEGSENWTLITSGISIRDISYTIPGLEIGAYAVQVRAVNVLGEGPWSPSATETIVYGADGYDADGFNAEGTYRNGTKYGPDGYDADGFNAEGTYRDGTKYDPDGYDADGFNAEGTYRDGTDRDEYGYDIYGYTTAHVHRTDFVLASENSAPRGIWSNGTTMWVVDWDDDKLYAYNMETKARDSSKDIALTSANNNPFGIGSDGTTIWVSNVQSLTGLGKTYAYTISTGEPDNDKTIDFGAALGSGNLMGIWTDGTTMWAMNILRWIHAYTVATKARVSETSGGTTTYPMDFSVIANVLRVRNLWSNGTTMWIVDNSTSKIITYTISTQLYDPAKEIALPSYSGTPLNNPYFGIWSDETTMWVVHEDDGIIYAYDLSTRARPPMAPEPAE